MGLFLADKACLSNQSCYIIHCLLNADDNPTDGSLKLKTESSTVHTRMVNAKIFGCNSRMGDFVGDSRDTIVEWSTCGENARSNKQLYLRASAEKRKG